MKKICAVLAAAVMLLMPLSASASYELYEIADEDESASLTVTLSVTDNSTYEETAVEGAVVCIYKVAAYEEDGGGITYVPCGDYVDYEVDYEGMTTSESNELALELAEILPSLGGTESMTGVTDEDGQVTFDDLEFGIYLVTQANEVDGFEQMAPYIIQVPYYDGTDWTYDVESYPKTAIEIIVEEPESVTPGSDTTDTGDAAYIFPAVLVLAVMAAAAVLIVRKKRAVSGM